MHLPGLLLLLLTSAVAAVPAGPPGQAPDPASAPTHGEAPRSLAAAVRGPSPHAQQQAQPQRARLEPKYFREAGMSDVLSHYDARFFTRLLDYDEHQDSLRHLIRSYLTSCARLGVETWLAHGTLLGYHWNGRIMPWDSDLDVQLSLPTLRHLATHHNGTYHAYAYRTAAGVLVEKTFLLDVNPYYVERQKGLGRNVIDARWIDTDTGMFVDITALAELDPQARPGVLSCKNRHHYRAKDLFPLREAVFEGVPASVPREFDMFLVQEYGPRSLVLQTWRDHYWHEEQKLWLKIQT